MVVHVILRCWYPFSSSVTFKLGSRPSKPSRSLACPNDISLNIWWNSVTCSKGVFILGKARAVTLKMKLRSPKPELLACPNARYFCKFGRRHSVSLKMGWSLKPNQFLPISQCYVSASLVRIHLPLQEVDADKVHLCKTFLWNNHVNKKFLWNNVNKTLLWKKCG